MFKKFLSLFMWWKPSDRGVTQKPGSSGFNHNPRPADAPWPNPAGTNRRIQPEQMAPFKTGTPHDRMHDLIVAGKPDALIAIELGVDIAAVRNYRHIISAPARAAARMRAAESQVAKMLVRGVRDEDIASDLGLDLQTVRNIRDARNRALRQPRVSDQPRVPAALLRRAEKLNETYGKLSGWNYYDPSDCLAPHPAPPTDTLSSGQGGDFGGAGSTGSWDGERS